MESTFDILNKNLANKSNKMNKSTAPSSINTIEKESLTDVVDRWKSNKNPKDTEFILNSLKPTISSAINSYAPGMEKELKVKAASIALKSLDNYNKDSGADPKTYVFHNLKRLNRVVSDRNNIIHIPEQVSFDLNKVNTAISKFYDDKDREPTMEELSDITGFSISKINKLLNNNNSIVSESSTLSDESEKSTISKKVLTDKDYFDYVYRSVDPIDKKIMEWSSGIYSNKIKSNIEIARDLKITPSAVSQRKNKIYNMLSEVRSLL